MWNRVVYIGVLLSFLPFTKAFAEGSEGDAPLEENEEMVVEVKAKKRLTHKPQSTSSTEVNRAQIAKLPQGTETSLPRLLSTTTPGVVQGPFGQVFIRGNHANVQYQIDGVQLPESPSNTFGQVVSPRNIDRMEVITGGIPAEFGQRLSAVVNIVTKSGPEKPEGEIELNYGSYSTTSPHLLYGGSTESGRLHYFFSLNYFQTDRGLDTPQPDSFWNQAQGGKESVHNQANGNSQFVKMDWLADNENKISWVLSNNYSSFQIPNYPASYNPGVSPWSSFFSPGYVDNFGNTRDSTTPTFNYFPPNTHDSQTEVNTFAQVVWKHTLTERSYFQLAPYYKYSALRVDNDPTNDLYANNNPVLMGQNISFAEDRHIHNLGFKGDYTFRPHEDHLVKTGFQLQASRADGTVNMINTTASFSDNSPNVGYYESLYIQDDYTLTKSLILNAGLRFDATQFIFSGQSPTDSMLQPRIGLNYFLNDSTQFHIFYGKLFQPAPVENLRYDYIPGMGFQSLQSTDLKAEKDDYYELGVAHHLLSKQLISLNFYYKDGVNILDDSQLGNTSIAQPYNYATGFAYGAEASVKGEIVEDWSEFINYSYSIAKGKGRSGGIGGTVTTDYQFLDHVQEHTVNAGLTYSKNYFWWTGLALYGSGLRTGSNNSISLPGHLTFDTTLGYEFHGKSWLSQFRLSGDVLNIFDNAYPITIANGFNGSHYAAGRQFYIRLAKLF